ncbi:sigma-70 family RNA polymerase sigma factor [Desulfohalovibrio reitneri]|uniref:sigma-70 family RNA polymerase sigma factor n=1 Tax=Desulfohalovibrio reitneri TaxID=1307759 RepID=UPI0009DE9EEF|nr:RNA polymerase factor sigma-32 [Desulfohalovibrio reitneri]
MSAKRRKKNDTANGEDSPGASGEHPEESAEQEINLAEEDLEETPDDFQLSNELATQGVATNDPLKLYLREISRFPMLQPEEETELARRVRDHADQDAAFRLVSSHLRLVVKIAMDFQRRWMQNVLDLIQEGNVGLMRAVQKFDPEKGIKFSYYAAFWIKAYILKFIMDNWRMVKIGTTQTQRKLFYNLNKERQRLQAMGFEPTSEALSKKLGVTEEDITQMDLRMSKGDMSLDLPLGEDTTTTRLDFLPALGPGVEQTLADDEMAGLLRQQLDKLRPELNDKERDIMEQRLLADSPVTLREIGEKYGITRERVRQIESRLLEKLRTHLSKSIKDFSEEWIESNE